MWSSSHASLTTVTQTAATHTRVHADLAGGIAEDFMLCITQRQYNEPRVWIETSDVPTTTTAPLLPLPSAPPADGAPAAHVLANDAVLSNDTDTAVTATASATASESNTVAVMLSLYPDVAAMPFKKQSKGEYVLVVDR